MKLVSVNYKCDYCNAECRTSLNLEIERGDDEKEVIKDSLTDMICLFGGVARWEVDDGDN